MAFLTGVAQLVGICAAVLLAWYAVPRLAATQGVGAQPTTAEPARPPASSGTPARQVELLNAGALDARDLQGAPPDPAIVSNVPPEAHDEVTWPWPWPESAQEAAGSKSHQKLAPQSYRTVCVRLCDGGYFPISFATTRARFAEDEAVCRSGCGTPARLYVYRNPGGVPDYMHDLDGNAYTELNAAFQFRSAYDPACTCRPQPWTIAAENRHREYAQELPVEANGEQTTAEISAPPFPPAEGSPATGAADGAGGAEPLAAQPEMPEARTRRRGVRTAPESLAAALGRDSAYAPRRREAASRRYDGTDWRITPYQPF